ncbi:MAG: hypothetical protein ACRCXD_12145, partial [Luteolibacter sp.]
MKSPLATPGHCASVSIICGLGLAALSGAVDPAAAPVLAGTFSWLAGVVGGPLQSWLGSKIKAAPPGAEEVFRNHHIAAVIRRAVISTVQDKAEEVRESTGNVSDLFRDSGEILADRLDVLLVNPTGPFAELRDFNVTTILGDFVAHEGNVPVLTLALWTALIDDTPALTSLPAHERIHLAEGLHHRFGEALWGLFKHNAAHDRQAFAALELLYLSRILQAVQARPEHTPPDLSPLVERIGLLMNQLEERQRPYFLAILEDTTEIKGMLRQVLAAVTKPQPTIDSLHTLPPVPRGFTGRVGELDALRKSSARGAAHLTGLKGMGGIGKTALALVLAHEWAPRFPDAALLLDGKGLAGDAAPTAAQLM